MAAAAADAETPAPPPPPAVVEAPDPAPGGGVGACPDFAVVCSFLERYGALLDLPELSFPELEEALEETGAVAKPLMELHLKLMRKIGKSVTTDRWEKYLIKICQDYNSTWAWEMEKKGYQEMSLECKVGLLKHLCECQFDDNLKFKNIINEEDGDAMRLQPIGRDKDGLMYWFQLDQDHNIRMYIEEQDDQDGSTWKCIVRTRNELAETLELLKAQIDPALLKKIEPQEGSSHENPSPDDEVKKENEEKSVEDGEIDKPEAKSPKDESICKTEKEVLKTPSEIKIEPSADLDEGKSVVKEVNDSFKENIKPLKVEEKTEPKELKESKANAEIIPPPQEPERSEISVIVKRTEDPVEKSVGETEKIKNDQQAKIPLKKRELKLTDDFDNSVKTSLSKSVTPTKEMLLKDEGKQEEDNQKSSVGTCANVDGKQLLNGEVSSEKVVQNSKVDQAESNSNIRESIVVSTKDDNGLPNEKRSIGVIKSLTVIKENNKTSNDNMEKNARDLGNDLLSPLAEESNLKPPVKGELGEVGLKKDCLEDKNGENRKKELTVISSKGKLAVDKETSKKSLSSVLSKESELVDKTGKVTAGDGQLTDTPPPETDECNEDNKAEPSLKQKSDEDRGDESTDKLDAKKEIATKKAIESEASRKPSIAKDSTSKQEVPIESKESTENEKNKTSELTTPNEMAKKEKSAEPERRTRTTRTRHKLVSKESLPESQSTKDNKVDDPKPANDEMEKSSKTEKLGPASKSRHQNKVVQEEENSGTDCKEMTSERQKDGLKLTIRISNKRKRTELSQITAVEDPEDAEMEENTTRTLRRSPRISRPSAKAAEVKDRKPEKKQSDDEEKPPSKPEKDEERKSEKDLCPKIKKKPRQRRRARWTNFRSRRRRKESSEEESEETDSEEDSEVGSEDENKGVPGEDDEPCKKCGLPNHPELILLCDSCDSGYHTACLRPPLMLIPDGEWFCPPCQHKLLCDKLDEQLQNLDVVLKKKERAERRKERLVYVGISIENIIPTQEQEEVAEVVEKEEKKKKKPKPLERRSTRARKCISYRFDEFDEAIDEAIEEDIRDADGGGGAGRGKDMSNITGHRGKDISTILEGERTEGKRPQRTVTRRKKRRRLNDLDSDSNMDEEESEDEFRISDGSEEEFVVSDENAPESEDDQQSNDSDFGARKPRRHYRRPMRKSSRLKKRSSRRKYSDDDEDESDDDAEESETEESSDYSDDYLDTRRRRSRRNQKRQVNYREDSESDGSQKGARYGRGKEMRRVLKRRFSSSESSDDDSADERLRTEKKPLLRKRIRSSNDELSEEEKPVRKRLNRIETDDDEDDDEEGKEGKEGKAESITEKPAVVEKPLPTSTVQESTKKPCYRIESDDEDDFDNVGKDGSPLDYSLVDLPSTNGQSPGKTIETLIGKPNEKSQNSKDTSANISQASNGTVSSQEAVVPEEDEDELLRVTDLVDYVCNSEQL
ncbi:remodeling and spacing factor 1 [Pelobates cultripes]|uniref:Remodeling and spacing factor 1 n=2 Tax=Pelobates cultripes TaxID=61616 RepID=A0AAD1VPG4_PELCU|nr:remodeling and spacing factor 1 [Pelobates cultripes]